jgi:hypothetical protein
MESHPGSQLSLAAKSRESHAHNEREQAAELKSPTMPPIVP